MLRSLRRGALPVLLCCTAAAGVAGTGTAGATSIHSGTTDAAGIRLSLHDPNVVPLLAGGGTDIGSPQSQATADSFGRARALSSLAYPGGDIAGLSTFLGVALPPSVPVRELPAYPMTVVADQTTPHPDAMTSPAYDLAARVDPGRTTSTASAGASPLLSPGGNATARGTVTTTTGGGLVATAGAEVTGFRLAGLLSLGTVTTTATVSRTADGTLQRDTSFDLTGATVAGLPVSVRDGTLVVPVLGEAVDLSEAIATLPALAPLKERGITLSLQSAEATPNGVVAPTVRVSLTIDLPALPIPSVPLPQLLPQQPQVGPLPANTLTVVYTLGYASATATLNPLPDIAAPAPADSGQPAPPNSTAPLDASRGATASLTSPGTPPLVAPVDAHPVATGPPLALAGREPLDITSLYLAIVLTALAALALGQLTRRAGIRTGALT